MVGSLIGGSWHYRHRDSDAGHRDSRRKAKTMISFAIGIGGLFAAVLVLKVVAERWMRLERIRREREDKPRFVDAAIIDVERLQGALSQTPREVVRLRTY